MVDTVVLLLSPSMYKIDDPYKFLPAAQWAINNTFIPGIRSKQNPTKKELRAGMYKPRLTLEHRMGVHGHAENILKIELSLPKLFFGNNFNELQYKDFKPLVHKLVATLYKMGVTTDIESLSHAPVSVIHYSKNILFNDGSTPYHYINKIKESYVPFTLDINQTDYRNDGHSYKLHSNSYEVVFYDKIRDLEKAKKSDKRAIEKDNDIQLNLFEPLRSHNKLEVLRMEIRLNKRQKMKQLFNKLNIQSELTFKKLFKPAISKKVLLHQLDELERKRSPLFDAKTNNYKALLIDLITNNPELRPKQVLQLYGLKCALDIMQPRELRKVFGDRNVRNWQRLVDDASNVKLPKTESSLKTLREQICTPPAKTL